MAKGERDLVKQSLAAGGSFAVMTLREVKL